MLVYCVRSCFSECSSIAPGHAFQNGSHLNSGLLRQVILFKMAFEIECISIASGHAFQNASPLNAPLLCQVTLFKMPAL
jgi:hypothetical protein